MPFFFTACVGTAALKLRHKGFPFRLTRQSGQPCHVTLPIEIIHGVTNHKKMCSFTVNLHIENADFTLSGLNLRPHMGVCFTVFFNHNRIVNEFQRLAITFHFF